MPGQDGSNQRLRWLEWIKAIALVLIIFNHALERMGEYPFIANPQADWEPLAGRVDQLAPTTGGLWDLAFNGFRYLGLFGEVGVQLFIIASGIGLTLSAMRRDGIDDGFLKRRVNRVAPMWLVVHGLALLASIPVLLFIGGKAVDLVAAPWDIRYWSSLLGIRITPETIYYLVPAWWFIALLIQLYLVFPFLYRALDRWGTRALWYLAGAAVAIRLLGLLVLESYLDVWARGAIFVTRLPEFLFGMLVAVWLVSERNPLRSSRALGAAFVAIPVGVASSLFLVGNAWGPALFGIGLFVVLYRSLANRESEGRVARWAEWVGRHSLSLFIVHQPVYFILMPGGMAGPGRVIGGFLVASVFTVVGALVLERIVAVIQRIWARWSQQGVALRRAAAIGIGALVVYAALVGVDLWVRSVDPQEALGWGERPSLQEDDELGWRLIPNQTTRLQWQSYDYQVTANPQGFPGSAEPPAAGSVRILTLGDAFTSAEGVDTDDSWPRLLEGRLGTATVWNGAITGFGPRQYAMVAEELAPALEPEIVVVGFFVNDFSDAEGDVAEMAEDVGFDRPDPTGPWPSLQWGHLSKYLRYHVTEPALAVAGLANRTGYLLGQFSAFEPEELGADTLGYAITVDALSKVKRTAPEARLVLMLVPASIQICEPDELEYYPDNVEISDYDLDQPQRLAIAVAESVGAEVLDLRTALGGAPTCPYQAGNMHWTEAGHEIAADALAAHLNSS